MTVEAIKEAILALPEGDRIALQEWLADQWDEQMENDFSPGGRGTTLIERVDAKIDAGKFRPLDRH
jgi:hypothetical protein